MIVDGRAIAGELLSAVAEKTKKLSFTPKLGVITCAPGLETRQYLDLKQRKAKQVGIDLVVVELPIDASTEDCVACVERLSTSTHGVIVQLPLPASIDRERVLNAIPVNQDPDGFAYGENNQSVLPPVAAAINLISIKHQVEWKDKNVVVVGYGKLVGQPVAKYAETKGAEVTVITESSDDYFKIIKDADILVLGVGQPHFITGDLVKEGVVIFDAGASEEGGVVVGDADESTHSRASLVSPVPGGIGPITVAALLDNLLKLIRQ